MWTPKFVDNRVFIGSTFVLCAACTPRVSAQIPTNDPAMRSSEAPPAVVIEHDGSAVPEPPDDGFAWDDSAALAELLRIRAEPSSSLWDEKVMEIFLRHYDRDRSGWVDNPEEIALISCEVYRALDEGVTQNRGGSSITAVYGFDFDYIWVGSAIGFAEDQRRVIAKAMYACGLPFSIVP